MVAPMIRGRSTLPHAAISDSCEQAAARRSTDSDYFFGGAVSHQNGFGSGFATGQITSSVLAS